MAGRLPDLPVSAALPELEKALRSGGQAVLQAPPGAGKTTMVPLFLLQQELVTGRILMLEPRRIAARAAAGRMAELLETDLGKVVGYRVRGEARTSNSVRVEVVTEGILTRMIQSDPELTGIGCVIFDEFHERSLQADLGLALCLEIRSALRPDLQLIVMSATLDAAPVAALMGQAPVITAEGRMFPVETRWLERPLGDRRIEDETAAATRQSLAATAGDILVFLPGEAEIFRVASRLADCGAEVLPLFGSLPFDRQRLVLQPGNDRRVVLATSIAETSLTLPGVTAVIDSGLSRRARFDPGSGMSRLETVRVTRAEAEQRRGRAGRVGPGLCLRIWSRAEEGGMIAHPPPEIASADLAPLALELALWGSADLPFLTIPPAPMLAAARDQLVRLEALAEDGTITPHGRMLAAMPVHPRLAHMMVRGGGKRAAQLAALLENRDLLQREGSPGADLSLRMEALQDAGRFEREHPFRVDRAARSRILDEARRLENLTSELSDNAYSDGALLALAYPDRIGQRREGAAPRYLLSGGKGAVLADGDDLGKSPMLVAANLDGDQREARLRLGLAVDQAEIVRIFAGQLRRDRICEWSRRSGSVVSVERVVLDRLILEERPWKDAPAQAIAAALVQGIRDAGLDALPWNTTSRQLAERAQWLRRHGADIPDFSSQELSDNLEDWLLPHLGNMRRLSDLARLNLTQLLQGRLGWEGRQRLDELAPEAIHAPTGTRLAIDYSGEQPRVTVRLQEMFGTTTHPVIGPDRVPLLFELVSPAGRPVQMTADLPGFWANSYADVRRDLRGRYPRHPWPEDPAEAPPTRRAKPRQGVT